MAYAHWRLKDRYYRLLGVRCEDCGSEFFPPIRKCRRCGLTRLLDKEMPKEGKILTYTIVHDVMDGFERQEPLILGIIELDNKVKILGQIVDTSEEEIVVGRRVKAVLRKVMENGVSGQIFYGYKFAAK